MKPWKMPAGRSTYKPVKTEDTTEEHELESDSNSFDNFAQRKNHFTTFTSLLLGLLLIALFLAAIVGGVSLRNQSQPKAGPSPPEDPSFSDAISQATDSILTDTPPCPKRREWRTLSPTDQQSYISAVKCLLTKPSVLRMATSNTSAYSDFPYIHAHVGYRTHNSAPFLPWHRYLLHLYETTLRTNCGYDSGLVYWDWTLDADDLGSSPVFDPATGFGGDGDANGEITVGRHGRCVIDGPFAGVEALWYDVKYQPHCLSRGFRSDEGAGKMDGKDVSKASIDGVLALESYEKFVREMEVRVHDAIPFGIGGDFETFSAPFDPLFYLHHVQLDRLWWLWQQQQLPDRLREYAGHNGKHTVEQASLSDKVSMGPFAPAIIVETVMDTSGGDNMLCYSY